VSAPAAIRFVALLVIVAAYAFVYRTGEASVAGQNAQDALAAERLRAAHVTLARRPALERERASAAARTPERIATRGDVARFVHDAVRAARGCGARITSVSAAQHAGEPIALDVAIEGRYGGVLDAIRALARTAVPASIAIRSVANAGDASSAATVAAALHVVLNPPDRVQAPHAVAPG